MKRRSDQCTLQVGPVDRLTGLMRKQLVQAMSPHGRPSPSSIADAITVSDDKIRTRIPDRQADDPSGGHPIG
jgi:hypothetical protein